MLKRRTLLTSSLGLLAEAAWPFRRDAALLFAAESHETIPAWEPGVLEIHHIATGRGNSTLIVGPDGTTILIDAGEAHSAERAMSSPRPNGSLRAGQWIARYVERQLKRVNQQSLSVMVLTHLHGDHVGQADVSSPPSSQGSYKLTGAADVAEAIRVGEVIDRGWPDYAYPSVQTDASALNYIALAKALNSRGVRVQKASPGSASQLALRFHPERYPLFKSRVLAANGVVWSGDGESAHSLFPSLEGLSGEATPSENMCSMAMRFEYGNFRYYTGGDLVSDTTYGRYPWHDVETAAARACGPVSAAMANHHGYFDACGPEMVSALRPRVWVISTWHGSHPALSTLENFLSRDLYPGDRSVYALDMSEASMLVNDRFTNQLASIDGHVVLRVPANGETFMIYVVDATNEEGGVKAKTGSLPA